MNEGAGVAEVDIGDRIKLLEDPRRRDVERGKELRAGCPHNDKSGGSRGIETESTRQRASIVLAVAAAAAVPEPSESRLRGAGAPLLLGPSRHRESRSPSRTRAAECR